MSLFGGSSPKPLTNKPLLTKPIIPKPVPKPLPKPLPKPVSKPPAGFFGTKNYRSWYDLKQALKRAPLTVPGYNRGYTQAERLGLAKTLQQRQGTIGIDKNKLRTTLHFMKKERDWMKCVKNEDFAKKRELNKKIVEIENVLNKG